MNKFFFLGGAFVFSILCFAMPTQAEVLFSDNFDDGNYNGWTVIDGSWSAIDGVLGGTKTGWEHCPIIETSVSVNSTSVTLEFDTYLRTSFCRGPTICLKDAVNNEILQIHMEHCPFAGNYFIQGTVLGVAESYSWTADDNWHNLRFVAEGGIFDVYLDGTRVIQDVVYGDGTTLLSATKLWIGGWENETTGCAYDNIIVTSTSGPLLPDTVVSSLTIDTNPIVQPQSTTIRWTIKNQGDAEAIPVNYWFKVRLSDDSVYDESDTYVAGRQITINLATEEEYSSTFNFNSGDYDTGDFYLVAKVDTNDIVTESIESNNTANLQLTIEPFNGHTVQGYVKYSNGVGFGGREVALTGNGENLTDYTQADGYYHFDGLADGSYTVTAKESGGWTFTNNPQYPEVSGSNVWLLDMVGSLEIISQPGIPTGETNPLQGTSYTYTTSGATSNQGHAIEYQFNWGDSTTSAWSTSTSASQSWTSTGQYTVIVTARCQTHTDASQASDALTVNVISGEVISKPGTPSGQTSPVVNTSYTYTTSGATSSLGHDIEYQYDWGDGNTSGWSSSKSTSHAWTSIGQRQVTVTARCQTHTDKTNISDPLQLTVILSSELRLIIDTDPAVGDSDPDDGTALIYAFQSPELCTIEGITYGFGNFGHQISDSNGTRGANRMFDYYLLQLRKVIEVLQEDGAIENDTNLYRGHKESETWDNNEAHPQTGASDFIRETVRGNPGQITVVALGTLTNIATAMSHYPNGDPCNSDPNGFMRDCKELWIIGGGINMGNVFDPFTLSFFSAEFNIWRDRKAAEYVLKHAVTDDITDEPKIKMVPLNATWRLLIETTDIGEVENSGTRIGNYLSFPLRWWLNELHPFDCRQLDWSENGAIAIARGFNLAGGPEPTTWLPGLAVLAIDWLLSGQTSFVNVVNYMASLIPTRPPAFPPYDTIGMVLALEPNDPDLTIQTNDYKIFVNTTNGSTVIDENLTDREEVRVFTNFDDDNITERIINRWKRYDFHQVLENKKFIECSDADYVIKYYDLFTMDYQYEGPRNASLDATEYRILPTDPLPVYTDYFYHLPVGLAPYYSVTDNGMYRGRLIFDVNLPEDAFVTEVKLHIYCDKKKDWFDTGHRVSIYYCNPQENDAVGFWNSATETNKYVGNTHIGTLQAWRTVNLGSKAVSKLQDVVSDVSEGQFALLLTEDGDDHPCAWFDTSKDWKAYLEVDFDIVDCVDFDDLAEFVNYWLLPCSDPGWCEGYDFDESLWIDFADFAEFARHWRTCVE